MKAFSMKQKNSVGLDIGKSSVKLVEFQNVSDKTALTRIGMRAIPNPSKEALVDAIKSLSEELALSLKDVNISISGPSVIVRFVSMPRMREDELKSAIRFEAEKHIPFAIEDCIVDYQILKNDEKDNKSEVLLVAAKKALVLDRIAAVEESGLIVNLIDVDSFAVANSFFRNFDNYDAGKSAALLNMGANFANVIIVQGGTLRFARDVAMGQADPAAKNTLGGLLDELRLSFSYYENQSGKQIDELYLSGGPSGAAGLEGAFNEAFELKPVLWNPLQFADGSALSRNQGLAKTDFRHFAVAAGLAIR